MGLGLTLNPKPRRALKYLWKRGALRDACELLHESRAVRFAHHLGLDKRMIDFFGRQLLRLLTSATTRSGEAGLPTWLAGQPHLR